MYLCKIISRVSSYHITHTLSHQVEYRVFESTYIQLIRLSEFSINTKKQYKWQAPVTICAKLAGIIEMLNKDMDASFVNGCNDSLLLMFLVLSSGLNSWNIVIFQQRVRCIWAWLYITNKLGLSGVYIIIINKNSGAILKQSWFNPKIEASQKVTQNIWQGETSQTFFPSNLREKCYNLCLCSQPDAE